MQCPFLNIFDLQLVESVNTESMFMRGSLYNHTLHFLPYLYNY